jgi:catechol 2,3-dioxygenase-like lactoylglutathione lyase family enzyme
MALTLAPVLLGLIEPVAVPAAGFDRVQVNVADPQAATQWYAKNLGGHATTVGSAPAVAFGETIILFSKADGKIAGSVGCGIDHLGFSYEDLDATMKRFSNSGVKIVAGIEKDGPIRYAFINDPWSTLIEVVEDPDLHGFHHLHLATTDPRATLKWYTDVFGGKVTRFAGLIAGIRYINGWVLVKTVDQPLERTKGRAIDHVRWPVADLHATATKLRAVGTRFEVTRADVAGKRPVFVTGPDGVRINLVGRAGD